VRSCVGCVCASRWPIAHGSVCVCTDVRGTGGKKGADAYVPFVPAAGRQVKWYTCGYVMRVSLCFCGFLSGVFVIVFQRVRHVSNAPAIFSLKHSHIPTHPVRWFRHRRLPTRAARQCTTRRILVTPERKLNPAPTPLHVGHIQLTITMKCNDGCAEALCERQSNSQL
jgi:hypothetical protein